MTMVLKLLTYVTLRLQSSKQGILVVAVDDSCQHITVVGSVPVSADDFTETADAVARVLPQGLLVAGSYISSSGPVPWQPNTAVIVSATNTADTACWKINGQAAQHVTAIDSSASSQDAGLFVIPGFVPLRCHLDVQLCIMHTSTLPPSAVQAAVEQLQHSLLTQQLACVSDVVGAQQQQQVLINSSTMGSVQDLIGKHSSSAPCISLLPLQLTGSSDISSAPVFTYEPGQQEQAVTAVTLGLDVLCYAPNSMLAAHVLQLLIAPALRSQLSTMQQQLMQLAAEGQPLPSIRAYHFLPAALGPLPVSVCYPMLHDSLETTELKLLGVRQQLHSLLSLPDNVPMLRFSNALSWELVAAAGDSQGVPRAVRLRNVHEGLTPPGFGGQLYLINGAYEYYHYMQDKFNDNGWGCAYRSLQTIVSWFRLQNYTSKQIPSHRKIQEVLVSLGDKESSFIGSNNWIGAIELSYILDEYLGITSKVITVNKGSEIPSNARALAQHFVTQGTPVMIGGGVLAYTLLGVAFNQDTGEAAFLILDPHYTAGEDLKKIQGGTWVAWKQLGDSAAAGGPLFMKDAFYNFLCPQRPRTV